ncbi:Hypothetical predicted protein, partial [Podarcis lilfordi]
MAGKREITVFAKRKFPESAKRREQSNFAPEKLPLENSRTEKVGGGDRKRESKPPPPMGGQQFAPPRCNLAFLPHCLILAPCHRVETSLGPGLPLMGTPDGRVPW